MLLLLAFEGRLVPYIDVGGSLVDMALSLMGESMSKSDEAIEGEDTCRHLLLSEVIEDDVAEPPPPTWDRGC